MLYQIFQFLLEVAAGLVAGACLLRLYMQAQRIPFNNPVGRLVFALSDWLVMPIRRIVPAASKYDLSSLLAALVVQLAHYLLLWLMSSASGNPAMIPLLALLGLVRMTLTGLMGVLIIYAILSWVQPHAPIAAILARLSDPLLRPLRRIIPLIGGVDLSPLAALIVLQILLIVLANVQFSLLGQITML